MCKSTIKTLPESQWSFEVPKRDRRYFASFVFPGGYPIVYMMGDGEMMCPDCANGKNGSLARLPNEAGDNEDKQWTIVSAFAHYEGEPIVCCHCNAEIASAYGNPDAVEH